MYIYPQHAVPVTPETEVDVKAITVGSRDVLKLHSLRLWNYVWWFWLQFNEKGNIYIYREREKLGVV